MTTSLLSEDVERIAEGRIELRPTTQREAFAFIAQHHRHHDVPRGGLWWHAAADGEGRLVGVAIVGRPVSRELDEGFTCEVTRLATDGAPNACSLLYGAAARAALKDKGYRRILTYILASEDGASLRAAGWHRLWETRGGSWDCPSRRRIDRHPTEPKVAYGLGAWREIAEAAKRLAA